MAILLIAEHDNVAVSDQTAKALTAALKIGSEVDVLVAGSSAAGAAEHAARLMGVRKVLLAEADFMNEGLAEPLTATALSLADSYEAFVCAATSTGKNVAPRIAALLDVAQVSEIIEVVSSNTFKRPIYAGSIILTVQATDPKMVVTVRTSAFTSASEQPAAPIERVEAVGAANRSLFIENRLSANDRPELTSSKIVISGGRALGSSEKFRELILPLADKLGAAVGASRAAVDAGYAPNDWQVGQTGKIVAPDLYIAVGISGAIQHLAGMKDSKIIVAINSDPDAPIFHVADYGLVGDLFEIIPQLAELV